VNCFSAAETAAPLARSKATANTQRSLFLTVYPPKQWNSDLQRP
jgi:hypothetical protein